MPFQVNLTNCDLEPIHIPGKIQSHGFLIVADKEFNITACSENVSRFLPLNAVALLQQPVSVLEKYLHDSAPAGFLTLILSFGAINHNFGSFNPYALDINAKAFNLVISTSEDQYLLEFEPEFSDLESDPLKTIGSSLSTMLGDAKLSNLLEKAATQIQEIIGYDRVMIYQFHKDGHGEVVAEEKTEELEPLLGLHYPASDIPQQARALYKLNLTRLISNVEEEPSGIVGLANFAETPIDLSHAVLRAVSPIHIRYLKNMGVASSFSISLVANDELWGLVACHNYTPRFINYKERESAKLVGQILSSAINFRQKEESLIKLNQIKKAVVTLGKGLLRNENIERSLFDEPITLLDAVDATGVALFFNGQWYTEGVVPDERFLIELLGWLTANMEQQLYETNQLPIVYPAALRTKDNATGILACTLSKELGEYMIWFRPEFLESVNWAGKPEKPFEVDMNGMLTITPRKSFESWSEMVRFTSLPWSAEDLESALLVREEIIFAIGRKQIEVRVLNEKLKEAYEELGSFSYTISHDLKNPLATVKGFGELLKRNPSLDDKAQHMVDRILHSTGKMQTMIDEVLRYTVIGHNALPDAIDMQRLIEDLIQEFLVIEDSDQLSINTGDCLDVYGDQTMVMQVFSNLIGNAIKYSKATTTPVIDIKSEDTDLGILYAVKDNGIGIKTVDQDKIFDLFTRSEDVESYEGTGVGLSIVKKIMEKHSGKVWVESDVDTGSTFYVLFRKPELVN